MMLERLEQLTKKHYNSLSELAVKLGKKHTIFYNYKYRNIGSVILKEIEEKAGFSAQYIRAGLGSPYADNEPGRALQATINYESADETGKGNGVIMEYTNDGCQINWDILTKESAIILLEQVAKNIIKMNNDDIVKLVFFTQQGKEK